MQQTLQSIGDKTVASESEIKAKFLKHQSGSLLVLSLVLETLNEETKVTEQVHRVLSDAKFWKLCKDKEPIIRYAWFKLVSMVVRTCPDLSVEFAKKICSSTFSSLNDHDPVSAATLWECALYIVASEKLKVGSLLFKMIENFNCLFFLAVSKRTQLLEDPLPSIAIGLARRWSWKCGLDFSESSSFVELLAARSN